MKALAEQIAELDGALIYGRVAAVRGLMIEVAGPVNAMPVGARLTIETGINGGVPCEVIGFAGDNAVVMPFAAVEGVRRGCRAIVSNAAAAVRPSASWLGRVVNAHGQPIDGKGPLKPGTSPYPFRAPPPAAHTRRRVGGRSISASGRSTHSPPPAKVSGSASSRARASASRCCSRCWRATRPATSP